MGLGSSKEKEKQQQQKQISQNKTKTNQIHEKRKPQIEKDQNLQLEKSKEIKRKEREEKKQQKTKRKQARESRRVIRIQKAVRMKQQNDYFIEVKQNLTQIQQMIRMTKTRKNYLKSILLKVYPLKILKKQSVAQEFLETETGYLKFLKILVNGYMNPLEEKNHYKRR
ncbi:rho guanine nucleotide exchange factor [Anaeramoeba ignava]|uniref:Rho guanine nucleotide exchange factor n=1 Tax=Anaeramoeba ignava TaxID=1746090 RepID=A0A9Q0LKP6_ANAIG|nr:rho guanine nucleotide exchange factor [Anaeramoeba ignava]